MSAKESQVDVLVIGAGPGGLMSANGLAKFGVNVRIVDIREIKVAAGQADGIQPRIVEVLQSYGLAERLLREGNQLHMAAFYNPSPNGGIERTDRAPDVTSPTARFPFEVTLHQGAIEAIFHDSMRSYGLEVDRPIVPTSIEISQDPKLLADPHSHAVKVVLKHLDDDSTEVVHAKYVIGADGAHSWVRKNLGIVMEGEQTEYIWGVVDVTPETNFPDVRNKAVVHSNNGSGLIIPREGDKVRLYLQLTEIDVITNGRVDKSKIDAQKLLSVATKLFQPYTMTFPGEVEWWTIYIIGQRVASSFHKNERVFIAGDACHTHSPKAGQGMNASLNDAHNLIWKMTQVLRGWSTPSILSTYELERRKFAQDLIAFDRKWSAMFSGKPRTSDFQDGVSHEEFLNAFQAFGAFTSGTGIHYGPSAITDGKYQDYAKGLIIGERVIPQILFRAADGRPYEIQDLLPADVRFKVLVFAGDTNDKSQLLIINNLATELERILTRFSGNEKFENLFEILTISASKQVVDYISVPRIMRLHWSKVFVDQKHVQHPLGGTAYTTYGVAPSVGAVALVRPDGYVGAVAPLDKPEHIEEYLASFMIR